MSENHFFVLEGLYTLEILEEPGYKHYWAVYHDGSFIHGKVEGRFIRSMVGDSTKEDYSNIRHRTSGIYNTPEYALSFEPVVNFDLPDWVPDNWKEYEVPPFEEDSGGGSG